MFTTSDLSLNQYHHVFFQVAPATPHILTTHMYDNAMNSLGTIDTSFGTQSIVDVLTSFDQSGANPYAVGVDHAGSTKVNMDLAFLGVYNSVLKDKQHQSLMKFTNQTLLEPHSQATIHLVTVTAGKFYVNGVQQPYLLQNPGYYVFDQRHASNATHPLLLSTTEHGTHGGGTEYTTGVVKNGTPGSLNAYTLIQVNENTPDLFYYCANHTNMGGAFSNIDLVYYVKVVQNFLGEYVYAFSTTANGTFYNQMDLSFNAGQQYLFNVGDSSNTGYRLEFGSTVDDVATINTANVVRDGDEIVLDLNGYSGDPLVYFEDSSAGMGYVEAIESVEGISTTNFINTSVLTNINSDTYTLSGNSNSFANGNYIISCTNSIVTDFYNIVRKESDGYGTEYDWHGETYDYNPSYFGAEYTTANGVDYYGEWLEITMPYKLVLKNLYIIGRESVAQASRPKSVYMLGSNDGGATYELIVYISDTGTVPEVGGKTPYRSNTPITGVTSGYSTIRMVSNVLHSNSTVNMVSYWELTGDVISLVANTIYDVTVNTDSSTPIFDLSGTPQPEVSFTAGETYIFDQSDPTNAGYQIVFGSEPDASTNYTGKTIMGTPGQPGAYTQLELPTDFTGSLFYYHDTIPYMGYGPMTLSTDLSSAGYGDVVTFTVTNRTGVAETYTITGVASADINGADLSGSIGYGQQVDLSYVITSGGSDMVFSVGDLSANVSIANLTTYVFAVQDNAVGQPVFAVYDVSDAMYYNQPELSFVASNVYEFDLSSSVVDGGYTLVFGTEVDNSGTVVEGGYVTRQTDKVILDLRDYTGDALVYFEDSIAGMGYVFVDTTSQTFNETVATTVAPSSIECSSDTQVVVAKSGSNVLLSTNYGASYSVTAVGTSGTTMMVSSDGQYISICSNTDYVLSSDYGATFSSVANFTQTGMTNVRMSADGQYICGLSTNYKNVYVSNDSGSSWTTLSSNNGLPNLPGQATINDTAISATGEYMMLSANEFAGVLVSNDYGVSFALVPVTNGGSSVTYGRYIYMSHNGRCAVNFGVGGSAHNPYVYTSDYGVTWYVMNQLSIIPENDLDTVHFSYDGKYVYYRDKNRYSLVRDLYYSSDFGVTYSSTADTRFSGIDDICLDNNGNAFATKDNTNSIQRYYTTKAPVTYTVTVSGDPAVFDLSGTPQANISFMEGTSYVFYQSDPTNAGQTLVLGRTPDATTLFTEGVTVMGSAGQQGAYTQFVAPAGFTGDLFYYSDASAGMGMDWNVNETYMVSVQTNALDQPVFAFDLCGNGTFYNQPDLSFNTGEAYRFDVSDPANNGYTMVFGTEVDVSSTVLSDIDKVIRSGTPGSSGAYVVLTLKDYTGDALVYFEDSSAGMGYVKYEASATESFGTLEGENANEHFGNQISLNADGTRIIVFSGSNKVKCFEYSNGSWTQLGSTITTSNSTVSMDAIGNSISIANISSTTTANSYVYDLDGTNEWQLRGGSSFVTGSNKGSNHASKLSGNGEYFWSTGSTNYGNGFAFQYYYDGSSWVTTRTSDYGKFPRTYHIDTNYDGSVCVGTASNTDQFLVFPPTGTTIIQPTNISGNAISANLDGTRVAMVSGDGQYVRVYDKGADWSTWTLVGSAVSVTDMSTIALSDDGLRFVVGNPGYDLLNGTQDTGMIQVYELQNGVWTMLYE